MTFYIQEGFLLAGICIKQITTYARRSFYDKDDYLS